MISKEVVEAIYIYWRYTYKPLANLELAKVIVALTVLRSIDRPC
jgi:hypothetical protein